MLMERSAGRRDRLRKQLSKEGADALLVTNFTNVTYLTGFTGDDSYLLLTRSGQVLISDPRYTTQLGEECPGLELLIRPPGMSMVEGVKRAIESAKLSRVGVEGGSMTVGLWEQLRTALPKVEFAVANGWVESLREIKDKEEVAEIRQAIDYAQRAFGVLRASLRPERTEKEVADQLEHDIRLFGGKGCSFQSIIAVGPRAALPHARPTLARIEEDDFVLVDWGASGRLYKSDLTRVLVTGKVSTKLEKIYRVVLAAQQAAIAAIRPGVSCHDVDRVAREIIAKEGFGRYFGHGLGHGIGLDIHEGPRLATNYQVPLRPGMVVTVEPGIYLEGWGGVRIEDDVLVTKDGHEVLTHVPKSLDECIV
jgi:Xaa-Pro aminopeptidase